MKIEAENLELNKLVSGIESYLKEKGFSKVAKEPEDEDEVLKYWIENTDAGKTISVKIADHEGLGYDIIIEAMKSSFDFSVYNIGVAGLRAEEWWLGEGLESFKEDMDEILADDSLHDYADVIEEAKDLDESISRRPLRKQEGRMLTGKKGSISDLVLRHNDEIKALEGTPDANERLKDLVANFVVETDSEAVIAKIENEVLPIMETQSYARNVNYLWQMILKGDGLSNGKLYDRSRRFY